MFSFHKRQKGQAMAEYTILIPASIMIAISAGMIASFIGNSLQQTVDGLEGTGICMAEDAQDDHNDGPAFAQVGPHEVRLTSNVYNPATNQTTITYTVSSMDDPSISHWVLGIPQSVYGDIVSVTNESNYEFGADPTTGTTGMKFDTGYESASETGNNGNGNGNQVEHGNNGVGNGEDPAPPGNPPVNDGAGTSPGNPGNQGGANGGNGNQVEHGNNGVGNGEDPQPPGNPPVNDGEGSSPGNPGNQGGANGGGNGNGNGNGRGNASINDGYVLTSYRLTVDSGAINAVSRDITLLVSGQYVFEASQITIKAGQETYSAIISAPVRIDTEDNNTEQDCE